MNYDSVLSLPASYGVFPYKKFWDPKLIKQKSSQSRNIYIYRINDRLILKKPLSLRYQYSNGYYYIVFEQGPLIITVADEHVDNLAALFKEELCDAWNYYSLEEDDNLTEGAKIIKSWLRDNIIHS